MDQGLERDTGILNGFDEDKVRPQVRQDSRRQDRIGRQEVKI